MLQGVPGRNGITRTRSQRRARLRARAFASERLVTHHVPSPPPCTPRVASAAHMVPKPRSSAAAARRSASPSAGTILLGACATPIARQNDSTRVLSSRASQRRGRPPKRRRPAASVTCVIVKIAALRARRPGSKRSTARWMRAGGVGKRRSAFQNSSITERPRTSRWAQGSTFGSGSSPLPGLAPSRKASPPSSRSCAPRVAQPTTGPPKTTNRRPSRWRRSSPFRCRQSASASRCQDFDMAFLPGPGSRVEGAGPSAAAAGPRLEC